MSELSPWPAPKVTNHPEWIDRADVTFGFGHWFACDHTERPPDRMTVFLKACPRCMQMLMAAVTIPPRHDAIWPGWYNRRVHIEEAIRHPTVKMIGIKPTAGETDPTRKTG